MAQFDAQNVNNVKFGERAGLASLIFAGAGVALFVVLYTVARTTADSALEIIALTVPAATILLGTVGAAVCYFKFTLLAERMIRQYILDVFKEYAHGFHPEKRSLTFRLTFIDDAVEMTVNGYKELIVFDFSPFEGLSKQRRAFIVEEIGMRLVVTFMRLAEGGTEYQEVNYTVDTGGRNARLVPIIVEGQGFGRIYKAYLKNRDKY